MRIIAGTHRSRQILAPQDDLVTRPIIDRVKENLFNLLWSFGYFQEDESDLYVLDLFSGTGSLGLEALSRGAGHCLFIEKNRASEQLLEQNLALLDFQLQATVMHMDALSYAWMNMLAQPPGLVFCDPPYPMTRDAGQLARITDMLVSLADKVKPQTILVLRTDSQTQPPALAGWQGPNSHPYGSMTLHFYSVA